MSVLARGGGRRRLGAPAAAWIMLIVVGAVGLLALLRYAWWIFPLAVVGLIIWLLARNGAPKTPTAQELTVRLGQVPAMSGGQFEVFTADVMRALGYQAAVLGGSGDQGVDVIATATDGRIAIQCKNYKKAVGNKPVQEVYAGARYHNCSHAWVVAPAGFTKGAHDLARRVEVQLFDSNAIRAWIAQVDRAGRAEAGENERRVYYQMLDELHGLLYELEMVQRGDRGYPVGSENHSRISDAIADRNGRINDAIGRLGNYRDQHPGLESGEPAAERGKMQVRKDRADYVSTVRNLRGTLALVDEIEELREQHPDSPEILQQYKETRGKLENQVNEHRCNLDTLESRNPDMATSDPTRERADLEAAWSSRR